MNLGSFGPNSLKARVTLFTIAIFVISIWALSYYASRMLRNDMQKTLSEQQSLAASFAARQVNQELEDRFKILEKVASIVTPNVIRDKNSLDTLLGQRLILKGPFNGGVIVLDIDGTVIAETLALPSRIGTNYMDREYISATLKGGKPTLGQPVIGKEAQNPLFGMSVPIFDSKGKVIGALAGVTDLDKRNFLDKIAENWYSKGGYYLVIEPKSRLIITSTDKSRVMKTLPTGVGSIIERYIQGSDETGVTLNPLGVEVLTSVKHIPVSGWYVAASLPTAEVFAPIYAMQKYILIFTLFLTLLVGVLTQWMLRLQLSGLFATIKELAIMSNSEQQFKQLPVIRDDEIGQLIHGFNHLLETLRQREIALKESEQKLLAFNDELKSQVQEGVDNLMKIEKERQREHEALIQTEKMAQLGNMLGAIIHQWKQPLNSIALEVQDIRYAYRCNELNEKAIDDFIVSMMEKIKFMSKTADDFRDFYKPSKEKKYFSVIEQIELVVKIIAKQLKLSNINLMIEGDGSISVSGFTSEFKQVILNIINNAKDIFEERKTENPLLHIKVDTDGDMVVINITDNAGGIPSELLPDALFKPFTSTKGERGTGIGLSVSRTIVEENMQGKLSAKNDADGACFTIELPILKP